MLPNALPALSEIRTSQRLSTLPESRPAQKAMGNGWLDPTPLSL
jgi:hypothetical protein